MPEFPQRSDEAMPGWGYALTEQIKGLVDKIDGIRGEISNGRNEFRSEIRAWQDRHEREQEREFKRLFDEIVELKKNKAERSEVDPLRNNIRTVVMGVIMTVVFAILGLVVVNRAPIPSMEHFNSAPSK